MPLALVALSLSIWRIQQPSLHIKPWKNKYPFFFLFILIITDQIHTDLRGQGYLQSLSLKPCTRTELHVVPVSQKTHRSIIRCGYTPGDGRGR